MYAVIKTGGKQYKVAEGDFLKVEKLDNAVGDTIEFSEVLMVGGEKPSLALRLLPAHRLPPRLPCKAATRRCWYSNPSAARTAAS